jgi:hypothetical protein
VKRRKTNSAFHDGHTARRVQKFRNSEFRSGTRPSPEKALLCEKMFKTHILAPYFEEREGRRDLGLSNLNRH